MADEYVVRIVLDGVDNASDDIKKVDGNVEKLGGTMSATDGKMLMLAGGAASMAAGLNQMTGGLRKSISAMRDLGYINERTFQRWNDNILRVEIFTGALEFVGSGLWAIVGAQMMWINGNGKVTKTLSSMASRLRLLGVGLLAGTSFVLGMTVALAAFFALILIYRDELSGMVRRVGELGEKFNFANRAIEGARDSLLGWYDAVKRAGGEWKDDFNQSAREAGMGAGGPTRLA